MDKHRLGELNGVYGSVALPISPTEVTSRLDRSSLCGQACAQVEQLEFNW